MKRAAILLLTCASACTGQLATVEAEQIVADAGAVMIEVDTGASSSAPDATGNVPDSRPAPALDTGRSDALPAHLEASSDGDAALTVDAGSALPDGAWRDGGAARDARAESGDGSAKPTYTLAQTQLYSSGVHNTFPQQCEEGDLKCGGVAPFLYGVDVVPMRCVSGGWRLAIDPVLGTDLLTLSFECSPGCPINQLCSP